MTKILYEIPESDVNLYWHESLARVGIEGDVGKALTNVIREKEGGFVLTQATGRTDDNWELVGVPFWNFNTVDEKLYRTRRDVVWDRISSDEVLERLTCSDSFNKVHNIKYLFFILAYYYEDEVISKLHLENKQPYLYEAIINCAIILGCEIADQLYSSAYDESSPQQKNIKDFLACWRIYNKRRVIDSTDPTMSQSGLDAKASSWYLKVIKVTKE